MGKMVEHKGFEPLTHTLPVYMVLKLKLSATNL
jgi:hypothetical protein